MCGFEPELNWKLFSYCKQGGECDLQDQVILYGLGSSRYFFRKRSVEDKNLGLFIKSIMTRCIHCTRCVRFSEEIAGTKLLGALNRGQKTEIGTYISHIFASNISGNVIDLCPVGALTSRLYAFKSRPWELKTKESIDLTDSIGSNIFIAIKELNIIRITTKKNNLLSDAFISDKVRFSFDALTNLRVLESFWNFFFWRPLNLQSLFSHLKCELKFFFNILLISETLDYQNLLQIRSLENNSLKNLKIYSINTINFKVKNIYLSSQHENIVNLEQCVKLCYLLSSNLKLENIILNIKLRVKYFKTQISLFSSGFSYSTSFPNSFITLNLNSLFKFFESKKKISLIFMEEFQSWFILGNSINARVFTIDIAIFFKKIFPKNNFLRLNKSANSESFSFLNIQSVNSNILQKSQNVFMWNLEDNLYIHKLFLEFKNRHAYIYWVNSHSPLLAKKANFIIPTLTLFEKDGVFINFEGKAQKAYKSVLNSNTNIINFEFFFFFFKSCFYKTNTALKAPYYYFIEMSNKYIHTENDNFFCIQYKISINLNFFKKYPLKPSFEDFYQTDAFTKNSLNMFKRSKEIRKVSTNFY